MVTALLYKTYVRTAVRQLRSQTSDLLCCTHTHPHLNFTGAKLCIHENRQTDVSSYLCGHDKEVLFPFVGCSVYPYPYFYLPSSKSVLYHGGIYTFMCCNTKKVGKIRKKNKVSHSVYCPPPPATPPIYVNTTQH